MRALLVLLCAAFLIALSNVSFADEPCIECEELAGLPQARLITVVQEPSNVLDVVAFYENASATPPRQPIQDTVLVVEITNSTGLKELYIIYTDDEGEASFDFSAWSEGCINFKVLYCPFCIPDAPECGFLECLRFANIRTEAGYYDNIGAEITNISDIPDAIGATKPFPLNDSQYLPETRTANYCPPPLPLTETPALCLPLLIIFSLLAGSLYLTGRNPFAGFNIGAPRVGKHIRYQARGRGFYVSGMAIASAASSALRVASRIKKEGGVKAGLKQIVKEEKEIAKQRGAFGVTEVKRIGAAAKRGREIRKMVKEMRAEGASWAKISRRIGETAAGAGGRISREVGVGERGEAGGVVMTGSGEALVMPGTLSISPRFGELFGEGGKYGLGFLTYLVTSTSVGSIIDSMYRSGRVLDGKSDKSIFETAFIDYSARKQETTKAMGEMLGSIEVEGGKPVAGMKVKLGEGRGETLIMNTQPGEKEGTMVYTLRDPTGKAADGTVTVVTDANNKVIAQAYNIAGIGTVTVTEGKGGAPQFNLIPEGKKEAQPITQEHPQFDAIVTPYQATAAKETGLGVGKDASHLVVGVSTTMRDFSDMAATLSETQQREKEDERERRQDLLKQDSVAQMYVPDLRDEKASSTLQSTIGAKSVVGVKPVESEYGKEMSPTASFTVRVADAHAETFGSEKFQSSLSEKSGFKEGSMERTQFERTINNVINSTNPETLTKMTPKDFRQALFDAGMSERSAAKVKADAFDVVRDTAKEFEKTLKENVWGDDLKRTLGSDMSQISRIASTGYQIKDDNVSSLLVGKLDDVSMSPEMFMSPETRKELKEYAFLDSMSSDVQRMSEALKGGPKEANMGAFFNSLKNYAEKNSDFLQQVQANIAHSEGYMSDKTYDEMNQGLDKRREGEQLKSTLESSGVLSPDYEKRAREQAADLYAKGDLPSAYSVALSQREAHQAAGNKAAADTYGKAADMIAKEMEIGQPPPKTDAEMKSRLSGMNGTLKGAGNPERLAANAFGKYRNAEELAESGWDDIDGVKRRMMAYDSIKKAEEEYRKRAAKK